MKHSVVLAAVLAAGAAAQAQVFNVGNTGPLTGVGAFISQDFQVNNPGQITGFTIAANMLAATGGNWQSDMKLTLTGPNGSFVVGPNDGNPTGAWNNPAFGGTGMLPQNNGTAAQLNASYPVALGDGLGQWTVRLENTYTGTVNWENVTVTLVPAPGAAALLGMGGLLAFRRRR